MTLHEEIEAIFTENKSRLSTALMMELAEQIIEFLVPQVTNSMEEAEEMKKQLMAKILAQIESVKKQEEMNAD